VQQASPTYYERPHTHSHKHPCIVTLALSSLFTLILRTSESKHALNGTSTLIVVDQRRVVLPPWQLFADLSKTAAHIKLHSTLPSSLIPLMLECILDLTLPRVFSSETFPPPATRMPSLLLRHAVLERTSGTQPIASRVNHQSSMSYYYGSARQSFHLALNICCPCL
jgi:hypothetical protein